VVQRRFNLSSLTAVLAEDERFFYYYEKGDKEYAQL